MCVVFFFFKQKTAYELRISDWSSDVCSSDLGRFGDGRRPAQPAFLRRRERTFVTTSHLGTEHQPRHVQIARQRQRRVVAQFHSGTTGPAQQIGRATCRERVCQSVYISVVAASLKQKEKTETTTINTNT